MRWVLLLLVATLGVTVEADSAPLTRTASTATGPTAGERTTTASVSVDEAWASARRQAENEARSRHTEAAIASNAALKLRGVLTNAEPVDPGGLATLAGNDEVAMLLELQRRRRNADPNAGSGNVVADQMATSLLDTLAHLTAIDGTPPGSRPTDHPADEPHAGPQAPAPTGLPDRPERFPGTP